MTIDEAFSYLNQFKDTFPNQSEKYIKFLVIMMDFKSKSLDISHRIHIVGVIEKAKDLFKGHPSLLLGLNLFLPKGYEIVLNDGDENTYLMEQTLNFSVVDLFINLNSDKFSITDPFSRYTYLSYLDES
ncbi:hypothetical protein R3W88_011691 [Solanum pinnatisectum]|uniref:Uncharacterized protein n=1 Tax=Solanum pinnatisectum TaxID=50273 RepID=A0AAV9L7F4_9SOLN|nr:hypothetical protein R3W88_011691 [Solanum pinnatisectum]